jgi:hypothetical protein
LAQVSVLTHVPLEEQLQTALAGLLGVPLLPEHAVSPALHPPTHEADADPALPLTVHVVLDEVQLVPPTQVPVAEQVHTVPLGEAGAPSAPEHVVVPGAQLP